MALSDNEFPLLQLSIDAIMEKIAEMHLSLSIETDFRGLVDFLEEHDAFIYPSFDPKRSNLNSECFWFRLTDIYGRTVASHADRVYSTEDFCSLMETGELWFTGGRKVLEGRQVNLKRPPVLISGTIGHSGALWVDKAYRGRGLSLFLPYLSRSLCLRNFDTDFHTGLVFKGLADSKVPRLYYGYPHIDLCLDGFFPPTNRMEQVYLCWISQAEAIDRLHKLPLHEEYPVQFDQPLGAKVGIGPIAGADHQHIHLATVFGQRQ